jgi:hypothetical protein
VVRVPGYSSRGSGFDSRRYQIFWEVVDLERGPLSLGRIIEELLERKVAAPVYKTEINVRRDLFRWPRDTLYPLKLALTSPTSGGRSVGIVCWLTTSLKLCCWYHLLGILQRNISELLYCWFQCMNIYSTGTFPHITFLLQCSSLFFYNVCLQYGLPKFDSR